MRENPGMDLNLNLLTLARGLAGHAAARQSVIAQNVANADTPGYKAKDIAPFTEVLEQTAPDRFAMRVSRAGHLATTSEGPALRATDDARFGAESPNGNTVSIEDQMMRAVEVQQNHELALGVYRKSLDILRSTLGRR